MAHLNPESLFQSWVFSEQEQKLCSVLTLLQKQAIQNQICQLATERTTLEYNPTDPLKFLQRDAELKGQIIALQYLITLSNDAESRLASPNSQEI